MNSLEDLNTRGSAAFEFTDSRLATVIFDRVPSLYDLNRIVDFSADGTTITLTPNVEIEEVVNYQTADAQLIVTVNDITGSTISWDSLPGSLTLSQVGNTYTISGIDSSIVWEYAREFTWTVPAGYTSDSLFWLDVSISYYDEELGATRTVDWVVYDEDHYYVAQLEATATVETSPGMIKQLEADLEAEFSFREFGAELEANASIIAEATKIQGPFIATIISAEASVECIGTEIRLDFTKSSSVSTYTDTNVGAIGMYQNYIVTGYDNCGVEVWEVSGDGSISLDSRISITTADEQSGNTPRKIIDVDVKINGSYIYVAQSNTVELPSGNLTASTRVYRRLLSGGSWSKVFNGPGSSAFRYNGVEYHLASGGIHWLMPLGERSNDGFASTYERKLYMFKSTNGTSFSQQWTRDIGSDDLEEYTITDSYVWYMPFDELIGYPIATGSTTNSVNWTNNANGYGTPLGNTNNNIGTRGNICVVGGEDGHRVVNLTNGSILSSHASISTGNWEKVRLTDLYTALIDPSNRFAVYETANNYTAMKSSTTSAKDIAISLYGAALRTNNGITLWK